MASKRKKPRPKAVRAWGVFHHKDLIYSGGFPQAWIYHKHVDAKERARDAGFAVRRVTITIEEEGK